MNSAGALRAEIDSTARSALCAAFLSGDSLVDPTVDDTVLNGPLKSIWRAIIKRQRADQPLQLDVIAEEAGVTAVEIGAIIDSRYMIPSWSGPRHVRQLVELVSRLRALDLTSEISRRIAEGDGAKAVAEIAEVIAAGQPEGPSGAALDRVLGVPASISDWRKAIGPPWIVEGLVLTGSVTGVSAAGGAGKSLLLTDLAVRLAGGEGGRWLGCSSLPSAPVRVAVIEAECGKQRFLRRVRELQLGDAFSDSLVEAAEPNLMLWPAECLKERHRVVEVLPAFIVQHRPAVLILDPLRAFLPANVDDENDNLGVGRFVDALVSAAKLHDVAIVVVDHDSKDGRPARGASSKRDSLESLIHLKGGLGGDPDSLELALDKRRDAGGIERIFLRRVRGERTTDGLFPLRFEPKDSTPRVLDALETSIVEHLDNNGACSQAQIISSVGSQRTTVQRALNGLERRGAIRRTGAFMSRSPVFQISSAQLPMSAQ